MEDRTGISVEYARSVSYSEWNVDKTWSSQEWKSDELMEVRTRRPFVCPQRRASQHIVIDDEAESDLSLGSRSFVHRVNDQVRKDKKQSSMDATEDSEEHSVIWGLFMSSTLHASVFMGTHYLDNLHSIKKTENLTKTQMFDISEKLITEQTDEIYEVNGINSENPSWKYLSLIVDKQAINLQRTKVYVFSDYVLCLGEIHENPQSNIACEERLTW